MHLPSWRGRLMTCTFAEKIFPRVCVHWPRECQSDITTQFSSTWIFLSSRMMKSISDISVWTTPKSSVHLKMFSRRTRPHFVANILVMLIYNQSWDGFAYFHHWLQTLLNIEKELEITKSALVTACPKSCWYCRCITEYLTRAHVPGAVHPFRCRVCDQHNRHYISYTKSIGLNKK